MTRCGVVIGWGRSVEDADAILRRAVAELLGAAEGEVRTGRLCGRCGSDRHGRPWATGAQVSLSRSGPHLLTAVSRHQAVGVDVESVAGVARGWAPPDVLHPGERADTPQEQASLWCRKEAILKLRGTGLAVAMNEIRLDDYDVCDLPAPDGFRAALALGPSPAG